MHNNYYFLRQLSAELISKLTGFTLVSCFSQNKDELILEFNNAKSSFFIKASLTPELQCLSFPSSFHRAKKNSIDLFQPLVMMKVTGIRQFNNERSFAILLENGNSLAFTLHGARANVIWFQGNTVEEIFRNNFLADLEIKLDEIDRRIDWSFENFEKNQEALPLIYFTLGKQIWGYLKDHQFEKISITDKWKLFQNTLQILENPLYNVVDQNGLISLSLLPSDFTIHAYQNPIDAINEFFHKRISTSAFQKEKTSLLSQVNGKLKQANSYLEKNNQKLSELEGDTHYSQWADLIMANLNKIRQGDESIEVENFYNEQRPITIKLKKELNPQKNAEVFYRKGKNQAIEIKTLKDSIERKEKELHKLIALSTSLLASTQLSELKDLSSAVVSQVPDKQKTLALPYHEFEFKSYKIWVGKNAGANDTLTLKHSYKEDLWLHAKDVPGSHVLIKYQSGKPFPKDVIEQAAALAAWYSKRKNESLCPVAYTQKKFVRKRKGDPAGAVVVDREETILVEPKSI
ncbi:NFACT RNA binding domain-containing protein [soil metagenome]